MLSLRKGGSTQEILARFRLGARDSPDAGELAEDIEAQERYVKLPAERGR